MRSSTLMLSLRDWLKRQPWGTHTHSLSLSLTHTHTHIHTHTQGTHDLIGSNEVVNIDVFFQRDLFNSGISSAMSWNVQNVLFLCAQHMTEHTLEHQSAVSANPSAMSENQPAMSWKKNNNVSTVLFAGRNQKRPDQYWWKLNEWVLGTSETRCITLQHAATHCNMLQHTATHCNEA